MHKLLYTTLINTKNYIPQITLFFFFFLFCDFARTTAKPLKRVYYSFDYFACASKIFHFLTILIANVPLKMHRLRKVTVVIAYKFTM